MTLEEFLRATEKKEFLEPDSWEVMRMCSNCSIRYYITLTKKPNSMSLTFAFFSSVLVCVWLSVLAKCSVQM